MEAHIKQITDLYAKRRDLMCDSMEKYFPQEVKFNRPQGGLFTWVTLPEGIDAKALMRKAIAKNVAYVPGVIFYPNDGEVNHFRLNYSNMTEDRIVEGVKRLGELLHEELDK